MEFTKRKKVILDVDTGSDDAVAVMAALKSDLLEVEAICTVWGNLGVALTAYNTLAVCEALGQDIPVYAGCNQSMVKHLTPVRIPESDIKPIIKDGKELRMHFDRLEGLPATERTPEKLHAVEYYYKFLSETKEPITIIATGPLTNLGFLFRIAPELSHKVTELIIMGGGVEQTNASLCGEANVWNDPEALQIILDAGLHPTLVTLDATHSAALTEEDCAVLEGLGTFEGTFAASIIRQRIEYEQARFESRGPWSPIHDALAVCCAIEPALITRSLEVNSRVECTGLCDGELLIDRSARPKAPNAVLAVEGDKPRFAALITELFSRKTDSEAGK